MPLHDCHCHRLHIYNNGLFDLAATAGLDAQSTYILHIEPKYKKKTIKYNHDTLSTHPAPTQLVRVTGGSMLPLTRAGIAWNTRYTLYTGLCPEIYGGSSIFLTFYFGRLGGLVFVISNVKCWMLDVTWRTLAHFVWSSLWHVVTFFLFLGTVYFLTWLIPEWLNGLSGCFSDFLFGSRIFIVLFAN